MEFYILLILLIIYAAYRAWSSYLPPQEAGCFDNKELLSQDRLKLYNGQMTQDQFIRNIRNGKYRKVGK